MSYSLVINPHPATLNYSGHFPFRSPRKVIRSSSLRGTNINNPQYSIPYLSCQSMGGFEPDLNGFLNQKQSAATAGRVEPQLNGLEGGIEPDLNYFFPSQCDLTLRSGIKSKGAFVVDSFRSRNAVSLRFKASEPQASIANFGDVSRRSCHSLSTAPNFLPYGFLP